MNRIRRTISLALAVALVSLGAASVQAQRTYGTNDRQTGYLLRRVEIDANTFSRSINNALASGRYNRNTDDVNGYVQNFQSAISALRDQYNRRVAAAADVQNVLQQAAFINDFMMRNRLNATASNNWATLRSDLDALARAYNVSWDWNISQSQYPERRQNGGVFGGGYGDNRGGYGNNRGAYGRLTGTFRLDSTQSDSPNTVADRAVANLPYSERQRVRDQIMRRLEAPDMLAIERNGNNVTIASSRAPQTTFVANGAESREQMPNGSYSRVNAQITGDRLIVSSAGNRETDFTVTFDPIEGGQRLRVTRQIWNDRLGTNPIVVTDVYSRTSDTAQWDVYNGANRGYSETGSYSTASGGFIVPDGQMLTARLETDLSTRTANTGDPFTMTVTSPDQFAGATIEGHVANISRSGRVTGRSEMSLNFDSIRMRDGRTYQFAGFIDSVRSQGGDVVRVDNEGTVRDSNQTTKTEERAAVGTAVGAIIGAIAGGGKGAAIGAILGAGAGAGSVYAQGRNDLDLLSGSEVSIRASAPNR